jgi:hypothetical protein
MISAVRRIRSAALMGFGRSLSCASFFFCFFDASFISVDGRGWIRSIPEFPASLPPHVVSNWVLFGGDFGTAKVLIITIYS